MAEQAEAKIESYAEFWPHYLREHSAPATRAIHFFGTGLSTLAILALILTGNLWFIAVALIGGYGPAWVGHFFIEKNRPATLAYPLWSLISDYRMSWVWLIGHLPEELAKAGVQPPR